MYNANKKMPKVDPNYLLDTSAPVSDYWPSTSQPSPILGYALDGFPIYGPYDSEGNIVLASQLDECNFDYTNSRYYFTPDGSYVPTCLVGNVRVDDCFETIYDENRGFCKEGGIDNLFCDGESCLVGAKEFCEIPTLPLDINFQPSIFFIITMVCFIFDVTYCLLSVAWWYGGKLPTARLCPHRIVALTLLPSYLMFSSNYFILTGFYLDRNNPDGFQIMGGLITTYLNDSAASYLSVVGVVYSLVIAYLIQRAGDKILGLSSLLAEETSGVRNIVQMIKLISSSSSRKESLENEEAKNQKQTRKKTLNATIAAKTKTLKLIVQYLESLSSTWNEAASSNYLHSSRCIDLLYSTLPEVEQLAQNNSTFAGNVADRIIDMCNEVGMAHSKRLSLQRVRISVMLWVLNGVLSAAMFFGISIIHTGSER
ncbi:hypothetical protein TL16_g00940 [Triparma laevis f. inornata]|uniref:Uncharacterized protein n=1 Tax=Triparma laevis f. inornata TaxID=1714386 RepID=A0A9W6ZFB6_9STRA|nr:hypothetical protein TL16_g00940 [Triparma laevis f. inornata]